MTMTHSEKKHKGVYIPKGSELNIENKKLDPPETTYEKRKKILHRENVKKIVGGLYGSRSS